MLISVAGLGIPLNGFSQAGKIPPFRIILANGKLFKAEELPMGKPVAIIYFSPECDHCDKLMEKLGRQIKQLTKISIVMITWLPLDKVSKFEKKYPWVQQKNIYTGTEGNILFVKQYYNLEDLPFIALYTKNGDLVNSHSGEISTADLFNRLHDL
jgi:thiol-disulfide isomerase/thioredoxin